MYGFPSYPLEETIELDYDRRYSELHKVKKKEEPQCTKKNIWMFAQNKPSLIVEDIIAKYPNVDRDFLYETLLKRGVFKWLSVRRDLIRLKNSWKSIIAAHNYKKKDRRLRGSMNRLIECREQVRKLCHSERWASPDNDSRAKKWLENRLDKEVII
jgi:hypothetical protein